MVVHGHDGLDEITLAGPTEVAELKHGFVTEYSIEPKQFGIDSASIETMQVTNTVESKDMMLAVLENHSGPARDIVILNAAAAIYVSGLATDMWGGVAKAREMIETGKAKAKLDLLVKFSQALS